MSMHNKIVASVLQQRYSEPRTGWMQLACRAGAWGRLAQLASAAAGLGHWPLFGSSWVTSGFRANPVKMAISAQRLRTRGSLTLEGWFSLLRDQIGVVEGLFWFSYNYEWYYVVIALDFHSPLIASQVISVKIRGLGRVRSRVQTRGRQAVFAFIAPSLIELRISGYSDTVYIVYRNIPIPL